MTSYTEPFRVFSEKHTTSFDGAKKLIGNRGKNRASKHLIQYRERKVLDRVMVAGSLSARAVESGATLTGQRRVVCSVLEKSTDHPDAEQVFARARELEPRISLATVYRTPKALSDLGLVATQDFGDGRTRYEVKDEDHHDHLICVESGQVIEFYDPELERLKNEIANRLGFELESHSLELYGRPKSDSGFASKLGKTPHK